MDANPAGRSSRYRPDAMARYLCPCHRARIGSAIRPPDDSARQPLCILHCKHEGRGAALLHSHSISRHPKSQKPAARSVGTTRPPHPPSPQSACSATQLPTLPTWTLHRQNRHVSSLPLRGVQVMMKKAVVSICRDSGRARQVDGEKCGDGSGSGLDRHPAQPRSVGSASLVLARSRSTTTTEVRPWAPRLNGDDG